MPQPKNLTPDLHSTKLGCLMEGGLVDRAKLFFPYLIFLSFDKNISPEKKMFSWNKTA